MALKIRQNSLVYKFVILFVLSIWTIMSSQMSPENRNIRGRFEEGVVWSKH